MKARSRELQITFSGGCESVMRETAVSTVIERMNVDESRVLAARVNNEVCPLDKPLMVNSFIEPVLDDTRDGALVYRRSLCLLLAAAAHRIYPKVQLLCGHSLSSGYYYTIKEGGEGEVVKVEELEKEMKRLAEEKVGFESDLLSFTDAVKLFSAMGLNQTLEHLKYICPSSVVVNSVVDKNDDVIFSDISFGPLAPSASYLTAFALVPYGAGFILRFPRTKEPGVLPPFKEEKKLFELYSKYKEWGERVGVTNVAQINALVADRTIEDFVEICETFQQKQFADIADQVISRKSVRVVLIAGPSSSGKTTSAKKLALELEAVGLRPKVISLDCYYLSREQTPKDENGDYDYECLEALDVELINDNLLDLFAGKEVSIPSYNFTNGNRYYEKKNRMKLGENDILIMEGIHALNESLTPKIDAALKFKLYLSALTQINLDDHNRVSPSDNRMIRRIVRDSQFRGKSASETIAMWPNVKKGEELYIFPFQNCADAILNTALDYELSVLKVYAVPLLRCVSPTEREYSEARRLLSFLDNFAQIDSAAVPGRSIVREFIGKSAFRY